MEHRTAGGLQWDPAPEEHFTRRVWFAALSEPDDPEGLNALGVLFEPGARTDWHHHPGGQVLYFAAGVGYVRNTDGETIVGSSGDVVTIPPGEVHWHGATADSFMMHLSLTTGGATAWDTLKVTDDEYDSASR